MSEVDYKMLYKKINYTFHDETLIKQALTHRSVSSRNYERLEFLGDSIVNFVIAEDLCERFPKATEGALSRLRANLVKGDTLAALAKSFDLGENLLLGVGELKSGGNYRASILADTLEAIIAAIYLDSDINKCRDCILSWYEPYINDLSINKSYKDPKTRLQEYLQAKQLALPVYKVDRISGEAHDQIFYVICMVEELNLSAEGSGRNRRRAEQSAAEELLTLIESQAS